MYHPQHCHYNEDKILDQARRLWELNSGLGKGVRYVVSNPAARGHFDELFRTHFPKQYADGTIRVYHVPGNGM